MPEKKRHHYVPVAYLKAFANCGQHLAISRKDNPDIIIWANPDEAALRRFYYSQPMPDGSSNNNAIEDAFSKFETAWPSIAATLETSSPSNGVLGELLGFIGLQRVRVPAFRDAIEQSLEQFTWQQLNRLRNAGLLDPPPEHPDLLDHVEVSIDPHQSIHAMARLLSAHGPIIERFGYSILHNETNIDWITSDNPVAYFNRHAGKIIPYPVGVNGFGELIFPISPKTMIYGTTDDRGRYVRKGLKHLRVKDAERVRSLNRISAMFAYEALISRSALPIAFTRKYAETSPVLDPIFAGFDPENMRIPPFVFGVRRKLPKYKAA